MSATAIPAQYAKFITALLGVGIAYLTAYGATWNLQGFLVSLGAALAVFGVPNATPAAPVLAAAHPLEPPSGAVTIVPPDPPAHGSGM